MLIKCSAHASSIYRNLGMRHRERALSRKGEAAAVISARVTQAPATPELLLPDAAGAKRVFRAARNSAGPPSRLTLAQAAAGKVTRRRAKQRGKKAAEYQ